MAFVGWAVCLACAKRQMLPAAGGMKQSVDVPTQLLDVAKS